MLGYQQEIPVVPEPQLQGLGNDNTVSRNASSKFSNSGSAIKRMGGW